jgi:hypothetical protein
MGAGVPAGATMPNQTYISNCGSPASRRVGTFGSEGWRVAPVTAMGRSCPASICGSTFGTLSQTTGTLPATASLTAGALPR